MFPTEVEDLLRILKVKDTRIIGSSVWCGKGNDTDIAACIARDAPLMNVTGWECKTYSDIDSGSVMRLARTIGECKYDVILLPKDDFDRWVKAAVIMEAMINDSATFKSLCMTKGFRVMIYMYLRKKIKEEAQTIANTGLAIF